MKNPFKTDIDKFANLSEPTLSNAISSKKNAGRIMLVCTTIVSVCNLIVWLDKPTLHNFLWSFSLPAILFCNWLVNLQSVDTLRIIQRIKQQQKDSEKKPVISNTQLLFDKLNAMPKNAQELYALRILQKIDECAAETNSHD